MRQYPYQYGYGYGGGDKSLVLDLPGASGDYASTPPTLGSDLVANGTFGSDSVWSKGTGWSIAAGVAHCDGSQVAATNLAQTLTVDTSKTHQIVFTLTNFSAGVITPVFGGIAGTGRTANGTYAEVITPGSGVFNMQGDTNFIGDIDLVGVKELGAYDFDGDRTIIVRLALDDWTPASDEYIYSSLHDSTRFGFDITILTTGKIRIRWSPNGISPLISLESSVATGFTNGTTHYIKISLDVDNGAGGADADFAVGDDGVTFSALGTTQTDGSTTRVYASGESLGVGAQSRGGAPMAGRIYEAEYFDGIDGTLVANFLATDGVEGASTLTSIATGEVWTINGNASLVYVNG